MLSHQMYNKQDLIKYLANSKNAESAFATRAEAEKAVNQVLSGLKTMINEEDSEGVNLVGFGAFRKVTRAARQGRNPTTGEPIQIGESKNVSFRISKPFKEYLNNDNSNN